MTLTEMRAVIDAAIAGKKIQCRVIGNAVWCDCNDSPLFNFASYQYRIKPEPREFWIAVTVVYERKQDALDSRFGTPIHVREVLPDE